MTNINTISDLKQQMTGIYDESKRQIESKLKVINNEIKMIKNYHDILFNKSLELISKFENDSYIFSNMKLGLTTSDFTQATNNFIINPSNKKSITPPKQITNTSNNKKNINDYLNYNDMKRSYQNDLKNAIFNYQKKTGKNNNLLFKNVNEISSELLLKKKNVIKKNNQSMRNRERKMNINNLYNNTLNSYHNNSNSNRRKIDKKIKQPISISTAGNITPSTITKNYLTTSIEKSINKEEENNKKNEENEKRKFSIIDIPSLNQIEERKKEYKNASLKNKNKQNLFLKEILNDEIKEIQNAKEQCIYLCTKSNVVPFKLRIKFSKLIKNIYKLNSPSEILDDYIKFLDNKIKKIKVDLKNNYIPSFTVQSELNFINSNDENDFYNYDSDNEIILKYLKSILIICNPNKETNNLDCKELINQIKNASNGNIRNYLLNEERLKIINGFTYEKIDKFLKMFSEIKDEMNIGLPILLSKINLFIQEIYEFLDEKKKKYNNYLCFTNELNKLKQNQFLSKI